jgi:hypothetical protein
MGRGWMYIYITSPLCVHVMHIKWRKHEYCRILIYRLMYGQHSQLHVSPRPILIKLESLISHNSAFGKSNWRRDLREQVLQEAVTVQLEISSEEA